MTDTVDTTETTDLPASDRRALLRKIAIGGAGAAAGAVMLNNGRASAADGDPITTGAANVAHCPTFLAYDDASARGDRHEPAQRRRGPPHATAPSRPPSGGRRLRQRRCPTACTARPSLQLASASSQPTCPVPARARHRPERPRHRLDRRTCALPPWSETGPTNGKHLAGELYVDKDGTLWFTVPVPPPAAAGTVRFVKLAGSPASGSFHAIDPQRAYDSRQPSYAVKGVLAPNTNRVISVATDDTNGGAVTLPNAVPAGATAVQINVTAAA